MAGSGSVITINFCLSHLEGGKKTEFASTQTGTNGPCTVVKILGPRTVENPNPSNGAHTVAEGKKGIKMST